MKENHVTEKLSSFLNHELKPDERQKVGEHLLHCQDCRNEHDEIRLGVALANQLPRANAPEYLWSEIERNLNGRAKSKAFLIPQFSFFNSRNLAAACLCLGFVSILIGGILSLYFRLSPKTPEQQQAQVFQENRENPVVTQTTAEFPTNQNSTPEAPVTNSAAHNQSANNQIQTQTANSEVMILPKTNQLQPKESPNGIASAQNNLPAWNVETIAGTAKAGNQTVGEKGRLAVGEFLETDANSRAKIEVANIGQVEVAPNSRVRLVKTHKNGTSSFARPRTFARENTRSAETFIVDTPSAVAVDLGCEYTLEVDREGNNRLHVASGFVALEGNGRESIVPAGAICLTKKGKGIGTPFAESASAAFQKALARFDFQNGGSESLETIIKEAELYDSLTLWHLLPKTERKEREKIFDRLAGFVKPPAGATREGVLQLNKKMLDAWWIEVENVWFG